MIPIQTLDDPRVAEYRFLADHGALLRAGLFVAEGRLVLRRLVSQRRFRIRSVLLTRAAYTGVGPMLAALDSNVPVYLVDQPLMDGLAGFQIHRGCLALAERTVALTLDEIDLASAARLLVLEGVNNPDNVGGVFRSAAAFGVDAVLLGPKCGDPLYRKAVRTSMAGTLQVPFAEARPWPGLLTRLRERGFRVLALAPSKEARPLGDYPRDLPRVALMVGAEGAGLSAEALATADDRVRIPMAGSADSLNVTVAVSIALWHFSQASPTSSAR